MNIMVQNDCLKRCSGSKVKKSLGLLCLQCCSHSSSAFCSNPIVPNQAHLSVRLRAKRSTSIFYTNERDASSPLSHDSSSNQGHKNPARIINQRTGDATALKAVAKENTRRNVETHRKDAGAWYQREEMLQHEILTKEMESDLGSKIVIAKKLRDDMSAIIEENELQREEINGNLWDGSDGNSLWGTNNDGMDLSPDEEGMEYMSIYDNMSEGFGDSPSMETWKDSLENYNFSSDHRTASTLVKDGSKLSNSSIEADLKLLTDNEIISRLQIEGGKEELRSILLLGSEARTYLMRSNIRLVVSISKKWMGRSFAAGNKDGARAVNLYSGGWDRPSLDEVIQEGVLGLARAVDKYDPSRGLRFSTYSTHWITSYVRQCFQNASTGCLKVPSQLHEIKNSYRSLVKKYVEASEPIPSEEAIAAEIGVTLNRLRTAIRATESLLSIDEGAYNNVAYKGSGAGGDNAGDNSMLVLDRLQSTELPPEDFVEISFLRQTLENAMAAELSPHERDIVRLRLGLDDGQTRTVKQIVEECGGGITVSDVRSAERRAFKKLRSPNAVHSHNLMEYLEMIGLDVDSTTL